MPTLTKLLSPLGFRIRSAVRQKGTALSILSLVLLASVCFVHSETSAAGLTSDGKVVFGAVGHNDRPRRGPRYSYNKVSIEKQVDWMHQAGMKAYRAGCNDATCLRLLTVLAMKKMFLLRSIELRPDAARSEDDNYQIARTYAVNEAKRYRGGIKYYEASNELDVWVGMTGDGSTRSQYNVERYKVARGFLRGLVDGLHSVDSNIRVVVDDAGWCHYGFLQALWQDGVRWDITGLHFYDSHGRLEEVRCNKANLLKIHSEFGVPLWITEFNAERAVQKLDYAAGGEWLASNIQDIARLSKKYNIEAAFIYELLDEPDERKGQTDFGLLKWDGTAKENMTERVRQAILAVGSKAVK